MLSKKRKVRKVNRRSKQKSAYWRGEKTVLFFKRGIVVLSVLVVVAVAALGVKLSARTFLLKTIQVYDNSNLEESEVIDALNIREGESLLRISFDELESRLKNIAWIKKVLFRKQFPDTLMVKIEEAVPKALLSLNKRMFLIDGKGNILEEFKDKSTPFLPVIIGINPKTDRGGILEALKLVAAMSKRDAFSDKELKEIMLKSYGLAMNLDGEFVKVGLGRYAEKLDRWQEIEPEIRKRNIAINYIDLRFKDKVIVKPLKTVRKGRS